MFEIEGRVALVTGAGQNVGAGIARLLAAQGAALIVNDVRPERAAETVAAIEDAGGRALVAGFDVTDYDEVVAELARAEAQLGPVDILVNNAGNGGVGGMRPTPFRESDPASWDGPVDVNLFGVMNCSRAVINPMCERGWGRIITIASGAGVTGLNIGVAAYGAGKGGAIGFMRHLAVENARHGVTANSLAIGLMTMEDTTVTEALARQIPVKRTGVPEDIGYACVYLASPEASWVTGQTIHVNGGSLTT
ncbi:MAG: SDR family oxidoreductase [Acidimicrobiales bacterium]|nr:SDR family oxidoreductase [Acidimicrobiales bacterium]